MEKHPIFSKPVAVLGGGACGQTFAADLTLAGYDVNLFEMENFADKTLEPVLDSNIINLTGEQRNFKWFERGGCAKINLITTDMKKAVENAGLIIVAIPAIGLKPFFKLLIPHLKDDHVVSVFPNNFGSQILRKMMKDAGCDAKIVIGGWSSMPYGVRMIEPGKLDCIMRIKSIMWEAYPSKDGDKFIEVMGALPSFDGTLELKRGDTIFSVDLSNPNPVIHVPGSILNVGAMEVSETEGIFGIPKGKYSMYKHGMCPSVCRVQYAFYKEEKSIAEAMGIKMAEHSEDKFFWKGSIMGFEYWVPFVDVVMPPITGPNSVNHRYFSEDIPVGTVVRYLLAKKFDVKTPIIESMINIGSITCQKNFLKEGFSLEDLGIADLTKDQIVKLAKEGL